MTTTDRAEARGAKGEALLRLLLGALVMFLIWRGALLAFDLLGFSMAPGMGRCRKQWSPFGRGHLLLNGLFRWDAAWYLQIAERGYSYNPKRASSVAFYPLFPYLARYLGHVMPSIAAAGLVVSNVATVGAVFYLRRLARALFDDETGKFAAVLLLVFPTSLFLSAFYSEGLFLLLSTASMFYYVRRRWVWCGVLGFLAMMTRSTGMVLFAALSLDLVWRLLRRQERFEWRMFALFLIPLGLGAYMLILDHQVGDPLAFTKVMKHWHRRPTWPWQPLVGAFTGMDYTFRHVNQVQRFIDALCGVGFLLLGVLMAVKRERIVLSAFVLIGTILPLCTANLGGMNRYVLCLFPGLLFVAHESRGRPQAQRWLVYVSSLFLALFSLRFMRCGWAG